VHRFSFFVVDYDHQCLNWGHGINSCQVLALDMHRYVAVINCLMSCQLKCDSYKLFNGQKVVELVIKLII
jgi:hypothetical protein